MDLLPKYKMTLSVDFEKNQIVASIYENPRVPNNGFQ